MPRPLLSPLASLRTTAPAQIAPARALLTPTWLVALLVLIVNDHALKGSGLLPGVVTGKLSDFAGMIVAPVLLAALLRVRSRDGLLACFAAVAAVFAGIQISPAFAASWSALMGAVGFPWTITCDPSDLVALPVLGLAWHLLVPEMDGARGYGSLMHRSAAALSSLVGLWATVATSYIEPGEFDTEGFDELEGNLMVNNASDALLELEIRALRPELELDCAQLSLDPGRLLVPAAFAEPEARTLEPRENLTLDIDTDAACTAVWLEGPGVAPTMLFIEDPAETAELDSWPSESFDPSRLGGNALAVTPDANGGAWIGGANLRHTPEALPDPAAWGCELDPNEQRVDWSAPSFPTNEILAIDASDSAGCWTIELTPTLATGPAGEDYTWTLCTPAAALPFEAGERVELETSSGDDGHEILRVTLLDDDTLEPAVDGQGRLVRSAHYLRGAPRLDYLSSAIEHEFVSVPVLSCPWQAIPGCATVERRVELTLADAPKQLAPGQPLTFEQGNFLYTGVLAHARERAVVDPGCTDAGALELRHNLDLAVIIEPKS